MTGRASGEEVCFLCQNKYFEIGKGNRNAVKCEADLKKSERIRKSVGVLCKLLVEGSWDGRDGFTNTLTRIKNDQFDFGDKTLERCCCGECIYSLLELLRLQELVEESQERQQEVLEALKLKLAIEKSLNELPPEYVKVEDDSDCSLSSIEEEFVTCTSPTASIVNESVSSVMENESLELSEQNPVAIADNSNLTKLIKFYDIRDCYVPLVKVRLKDYPNLTIHNCAGEPDFAKASKVNGVTKCLKSGNNVYEDTSKINENQLPHPIKHLFYKINEDLLLLHYVPIKISPTDLTCLEKDCYYVVEDTDHSAFETIKFHVIDKHLRDEDVIIERACPIKDCSKLFSSEQGFRLHILHEHTKDGRKCESNKRTVICGTCKKPMPFHSYRNHMWSHKNFKEKMAAIDNGEPQPTHVRKNGFRGYVNKLKNKKSDCEGEKNGEQVSRKVNIDQNLYDHDQQQPQINQTQQNLDSVTTFKEQRRLHFYKINERLLLLLCTPIKIDPNGFTCLEVGCCFFAHGADYFTFEKMKSHIVQSHEMNYRPNTLTRTCPLCGMNFNNANIYRQHLLACHTEEGEKCKPPHHRTVICEVCWKPLSYHKYIWHFWHHKSEQDIKEALLSGEYIPTKARTISMVVRIAKSLGKIALGSLKTRIRKRRTFIKGPQNILTRPENLKSHQNHPKSSATILEESKRRNENETPPQKVVFGNDATAHLFLQLEDSLLYHDGVLIKVSSTELICLEGNCGIKANGLNYDSFEVFRSHVKFTHRWTIHATTPNISRTCPLCSQEFFDIAEFKDHIVKEHSPPAICTCCWKPFSNYKELSSHSLSHMNKVEGKATGYKSLTKISNINRIGRRQIKKNYPCQSCPRQCSSRIHLRLHEEVHKPKHLRNLLNCSYCNGMFLSNRSLQYHIERKHRPDLVTRKRECTFCGKQFHYNDGYVYRKHIKRHTGETQAPSWICDLCGKGFTQQHVLNKHMLLVHSDQRNFQCEFCEMNYKHRNNLERHRQTAHKCLVPPPNSLPLI